MLNVKAILEALKTLRGNALPGILCKNLGIPKLAIKKVPIKPDSILHL
jgi:hypothetical protein